LGLAATPVLAADGPGRDRNDQRAAQTQQQHQNVKTDKGDKRNRGQVRERRNTQPQGGQKPSGMNKTDWQNNNNANDRNRNNGNTRWNGNNDRRNDGDFNRNHQNDRTWDRNRNRGNININIYRRNVTSPRRFRIGTYHAPRGYYYRRWHYGERLPASYYARDYWLLDFIAFGLFAPPQGYVWVRYGSDALLIDEETGEIIQVRYDVFYS
jgi:Ni/Co efflux regulator RcnB